MRTLALMIAAALAAIAQTPQSCNPAITYIGPRLATPPMLCPGITTAADASAWAWKGTVTFPAASGSTQTNFTVVFTASDAKLKTTANGGAIRNTVTRVGVTVPADFVLTSDSTCATVAGSYTWGFESYSATAGTATVWVMIPSFSSAAATTIYACLGNALVSSYQGGAVGSEFDAATKGAWHLPDGTTLSVKDFSSSANDGTAVSAPTAAAGKVDGGAAVAGGSKITSTSTGFAAGSSSRTLSGWVKTSFTSAQAFFGYGSGVNGANYVIGSTYGAANKLYFVGYAADLQGIATVVDGLWHHLAATYDGTTLRLYVDGAPDASGPLSLNTGAGGVVMGVNTWAGADAMTGSMDEIRFDSTLRSANWIASEYANESSPPALSALTIP